MSRGKICFRGVSKRSADSSTAPVAESEITFTTPLEQIFPAVAAAVLAVFDLLEPFEQDEIVANCGTPEAYVSGLQMTWTR